jgi:pilus assembly protein CpaF
MKNNAIWNLLNDLAKKAGISEILINGPREIFVEKSGQFIQINANIPSEDILNFIKDVGEKNKKLINAENPILDGVLPDGSRINIIFPPFSYNGPAISIRKYLKFTDSLKAKPELFGITDFDYQFIKAIVQSRCNLIISGGTGVGKTTFLNFLIEEIPISERIITIEDTIELSLKHPNVVRLESRLGKESGEGLTVRDLVKNTLRMRPDRIIIGESRGAEMFDLLQAMNTGHEGSMTSMHANSALECLSRMETLFMLSGFDLPLIAVRKQMIDAVDYIIQLKRDKSGNRCVSEIIEITGMEGATILSQEIFVRNESGLVSTGFVPKNIQKLVDNAGLSNNYFDRG